MNNHVYYKSMSLQDDIASVEARIYAMDLSIAWVLRRVGVEKATWSHWKSGLRSPLKATWDKIVAEVGALEKGIS